MEPLEERALLAATVLGGEYPADTVGQTHEFQSAATDDVGSGELASAAPDAQTLLMAAGRGFGAAGDSLSDEYSTDYARNWVELLAEEKGVDFGPYADWGTPRSVGYENNWAVSGATTNSLLQSGQHTGLAQLIDTGAVSYAVLAIGQNDISPLSDSYQGIYSGDWSQTEIDAHIDGIVGNIDTALDTLTATGVALVMSNVIDFGVSPLTRFFYPSAASRARVTTVLEGLNDRLQILASEHHVPLVDTFGLARDFFGEGSSSTAARQIGGVSFAIAGGADPHNAFIMDRVHPHTVVQGAMGNGFLEAMSLGHGLDVGSLQFTEAQLLAAAGIGDEYVADTLGMDYSDYVVLPGTNTAPTADAGGPYEVAEGETLIVDGSGSSDLEQSQTTLVYAWDFDYDGTSFDVDATGMQPTFSASAIDGPATRTLGLRVTDDAGASDTASVDVFVDNVAPTIVLSGADTVDAGTDCTLTLGAITDPGTDTVTQWTVNWGDGLSDTYDSGGDRTHVYDDYGPYTVTVDLTDEDGTHAGSGSLDLTVLPVGQVDLGPIDSLLLEDLSLTAGNLYFRLETTHEGFLTLEVDVPQPPESVQLRLYDGNPLETPGPTLLEESSLDEDGNQRIDWPTLAGTVYYVEVYGSNRDFDLRIGNLVHHDGTTVTVFGTEDNDTFEFDAAASRDVTVNGVRYHFDDAQVESVTFNGGDGYDTVILDDSVGDDTLTAEAKHAVFSNSDQTPGFTVTMDGFEELQAYAKSGGNDEAFLHDSDGKDKFKSEQAENYAKMYGGRMYNRVKFFEQVEAFSSGEKDLARLFDTQGNDTFEGRQDVSWLRSDVFDVAVHNFRQVIAYAMEGGNDEATLKDSALDDEVYMKAHKSEIFDLQTKGEIYKITARRFDTVHADGSQGDGYDKVKIWETPRDNHVEADDNWAQLWDQKTEPEMLYDVLAFEFVKVRASTGGNDTSNVTEPLQFDLFFEDGWNV